MKRGTLRLQDIVPCIRVSGCNERVGHAYHVNSAAHSALVLEIAARHCAYSARHSRSRSSVAP